MFGAVSFKKRYLPTAPQYHNTLLPPLDNHIFLKLSGALSSVPYPDFPLYLHFKKFVFHQCSVMLLNIFSCHKSLPAEQLHSPDQNVCIFLFMCPVGNHPQTDKLLFFLCLLLFMILKMNLVRDYTLFDDEIPVCVYPDLSIKISELL